MRKKKKKETLDEMFEGISTKLLFVAQFHLFGDIFEFENTTYINMKMAETVQKRFILIPKKYNG